MHSTVTMQNNQRHNDTPHSLLHTAYRRRHSQYVKYTKRSGPFIVSPDCRRLSVASDRLAAGTDTWKFVTCYYTWVAAGHCVVVKYFYERPFAVLVANCALKHRYSRGAWRDRRARPVQYANWYSRLAQRVRDTNCTSLAQIQMIHIVVGKLLCYTLLHTVTMIKLGP